MHLHNEGVGSRCRGGTPPLPVGFFTTAVMRVKTSPTTDIRINAVMGMPTFIGSISAA